MFWSLRILRTDGAVEVIDLLDPSEIERDYKNSLPEGRLCVKFRGCREPITDWIACRFTHWEGDMVITPVANQPGSKAGGWTWEGEWEAVMVEDPVLAGLLR